MLHSFPQSLLKFALNTLPKERKTLIAVLAAAAFAVFSVSSVSVLSGNIASLGGGDKSSLEATAAAPSASSAKDIVTLKKLFPAIGGENRLQAILHHRWGNGVFLNSVLAPTVTATKTDALVTDVDGDLQADPGDTLEYTVNISASGEDATGVTFTDTVDPNTAFVGGSLTATPVAVDDSYSALGNVRISVPAPGVLGNDFAGVPAATITAPPVTSVNGGNVALNADGSFTYNPPSGFEGSDSFTYTLTNSAGSNNATVTITVSGMIWFVNNNATCPCDGRLTNPFDSLSAFAAVNNGAGNNPAANDNIFLYESATDYVGSVTLLSGQRFIGQDATASLSAITGLTPPTFSDPLPATNSGNGVIVNITSATTGITVASNNTLRGFTGGNSTTDILGTGFGTLTVSDVILNGTGQAVNLSTGTLAATFISISSSGGPNGIVLANTSGSFTVTGTGGTCTFATPTCSGGRITATVGADGAPAGIGVSLNNVTNISLTSMRIDNHPNFAIRGRDVTGFTLQSSVVDGNNGTSAIADVDGLVNGEDSIRFVNLLGSALIDDSFIGGGYEHNLRIVNNMGTLDRLTVSDSSIGDLDGAGPGRGVDNTNGDDNILLEARTAGTVLNATLTNNILNNARGDVIQTNATVGTSMDVVFRLNEVSNNHTNIAVGGGGAAFTGLGAVTYDISCNSFRDAVGIGLNIFKGRPANGQTGGTWSGTIFNNTIGVTGVAKSGSGDGASAMNVEAQGNGTHTTLVKNNVVRNYGEAGIKMSVVDANTVAPVTVTLNATVIGNVTAEPDPVFAFAGFFGTQGAVPGADANSTFNLKLGGAGAEQNNFTAGDPNDFNDVFIFQGSPPDGAFNLTRGNSVSSDPTTVVMDNNVSPITVFADAGIVVVAANPPLPAAIDETCSAPMMASFVPSKRGSEANAGRGKKGVESARTSAAKAAASVAAKPKQSGSTRYQQVAQLNDRQNSRTRSLKHHAAFTPPATASASLADVMLNIGTLPAGESVTITFRVTVDDPFMGSVAEVSNQGTVSGSNFADVLTDDPTVGGVADPTVTPIDTPDSVVTVAVSPAAVNEDGATNLVYTFTRTGFTATALTVNFSIGGTATFGASPNDYTQTGAATFTPPTGTVNFTAGSPTATVTVNPEADAISEPDETVIITVTSGAEYTVGSPDSATGTISNDDAVVTVVVAPTSTAEGGANLVYTFTRSGSTAAALTVNFTVGGTASFPGDYAQSGATTFTPPNATVTIGIGSSTAMVTVTPLTDCLSEGPETVEFTVVAGTGYSVGTPSTATGTITDVPDAVAPVITLDPNRPTTMWPPNHNYNNFTVSQFVLSASDACDPNVDASDVYITKIESDEAEDGAGDGNTLNDITIAGDCKSFQLRAERAVSGNGRVYTITFKVQDNQGNFSTATATVSVPQTMNGTAVGNGPMYTVISTCP